MSLRLLLPQPNTQAEAKCSFLEPSALVNVEQGHCQYRDKTSAAMSCWEQFEAYKN
jgi:hypothetical protein